MGKKSQPDAAGGSSRKTAAGRVLQQVDPDLIYFAHSRVRPTFTGNNVPIQQTLNEILEGTTKVTDIPYITILELEDAPARPADDESDDDDPRRKKGKGKKGKGAAQAPVEKTTFYCSLNNRRLYLFKALKKMGYLETIPVQVKPALEREKIKYTRKSCSLNAKLMGVGTELTAGGAEDGDEDEDDDDKP